MARVVLCEYMRSSCQLLRRQVNSLGHGCGHNLIAVAGVASAIALKHLLEQGLMSGKVVLYGTPAEGKRSQDRIIMLDRQESILQNGRAIHRENPSLKETSISR